MPSLPPGHVEQQPAVFRRMRAMFGLVDFPEPLVRRGRAGYYGLITYLDAKIGRLLEALEETGQREQTLVVYTSDHGEMAGEHGMWRKSNGYEHAARVPLLLSWPGHLPAGRRVEPVVSLVDVVATLADVAGVRPVAPLDGETLLPLARGDRGAEAAWKDEAFSEYLAHGVARPVAMLRRGRYKLIYSLDDAPLLYDLQEDPGELRNLGDDASHAAIREGLRARLLSHWDSIALERRVRRSQQARLLIRAATSRATAGDQRRSEP